MAASVTGFAGSIPEKYDRFLGPMLFEPYAIDIAQNSGLPEVRSILEIACGTGRVTKHLRQQFPAGVQLTATDLNGAMIAVAQHNNAGTAIEWTVADAQDLHFNDASFDLVICQFGFMFMPDKAKAFAEVHRVLKPGGCLRFNTWDSLANNPAFDFANNIVNSYFPDNPPVFYQIPFSFYDEKQIRALLAQPGFLNTKIELVKKRAVTGSAKDAATGIVEGNPVYSFICERNASMVDHIRDHVEKEIAARFGDHPFDAPMQAWVAEAWK